VQGVRDRAKKKHKKNKTSSMARRRVLVSRQSSEASAARQRLPGAGRHGSVLGLRHQEYVCFPPLMVGKLLKKASLSSAPRCAGAVGAAPQTADGQASGPRQQHQRTHTSTHFQKSKYWPVQWASSSPDAATRLMHAS